jgi:hypothetical protein
MDYTTYDENGLILGNIFTNSVENLTNFNYIEGTYDGDTHYIVDGEVVERPLLTSVASFDKTTLVPNGIDSCVISTLPECVVVVSYKDETLKPAFNEPITDGELEITADEPGTIVVTIDAFPYQQYNVELEAT